MKNQYLLFSTAFVIFLLFQNCSKKEFVPADNKNGNLRENWVSGETIVNGTYEIANPGGSKAINVVGESAANSAFLELRTYDGNKNSHNWTITSLGGGYYKIINVKSGKAIDVPLGQTTQGLQIWQYTYNGDNAQIWKIEYISGSGNKYKITNKLTGLALTRTGGSNADGTTITQNTYNGANNWQKWILSQVVYRDSVATDFFRRTSGWINSDGGATTLLNNGKVFWGMGDSNVDNMSGGQAPCFFNARNTGILQPSVTNWDWTAATTLWNPSYSGQKSFFKQYPNDDTKWGWPGCGFQPASNDTAYIYVTRLKTISGGYTEDGNPVFAKMKVSTNTPVAMKVLENLNGINFGIGFIKGGDGYIYAYGNKVTFIVSDVYVARFPESNPNAAWSFWNGTSWVAGATNATPIATGTDGNTGTGGWSNSVNVVKVNSKYVLITTELSVGCDQGKQIGVATSSSITGPFSNRKVIYSIPDRKSGHSPIFYLAYGHPEFNTASNELLITYCINGYGSCVTDCVGGYADPDVYRPKAIRVPFSVIDPNL